MDEKLPEGSGTELATMGSAQAALFEDPSRLLALSDGDMAVLVHDLHRSLGAVMPGIRRMVGLVAWAQWHRLPEGRYGGWLSDTAVVVGVDPQTIVRWRRKVTSAEKLAVPTAAQQRSVEAKAAGQVPRAIKMTPPDPVVGKMTPEPSPNGSESGATMEPASTATVPPPVASPAPPSPARTITDDELPPVTWDGRPTPTARQAVLRFLGVLRAYDPAELGKEMTAAEARTVREFAATIAKAGTITVKPSKDRTAKPAAIHRKTSRRTDVATKDCPHPVSRRLGKACGACGMDPIR